MPKQIGLQQINLPMTTNHIKSLINHLNDVSSSNYLLNKLESQCILKDDCNKSNLLYNKSKHFSLDVKKEKYIQNNIIDQNNWQVFYGERDFKSFDLFQLYQHQIVQKNKLKVIEEQNIMNTTVSQEDSKKLLNQLIMKGKRIQSLMKFSIQQKSLMEMKQDFQKILQQKQQYIVISQYILIDYFKKRRLGAKLRGLNGDLIQQIEGKLFTVIQNQFKLWLGMSECEKINDKFEESIQKMKDKLERNLHELNSCEG